MKQQVVVIGGGNDFKTYEDYLDYLKNLEIDIERYKTDKDDWKPWLRHKLGDEYEVIIPVMPNKTHAKFEEWKIFFEKFLPFLNDEVILIGHSLGGIFLSKYLSENKFPKEIKGAFLVAAVYDEDPRGYPITSFSLPSKLNLQTENIMMYHSEDDPVVPFSALEKYKKALPLAKTRVLKDKKHINQEEFPELFQDIINLNQ